MNASKVPLSAGLFFAVIAAATFTGTTVNGQSPLNVASGQYGFQLPLAPYCLIGSIQITVQASGGSLTGTWTGTPRSRSSACPKAWPSREAAGCQELRWLCSRRIACG